jgi:RNA methyltransferase, TrmH family
MGSLRLSWRATMTTNQPPHHNPTGDRHHPTHDRAASDAARGVNAGSSPSPLLQSLANPTVRHLIRMRDNRDRRKAGEILTDGVRQTSMALASGLTPIGLYVDQSQYDQVLAELSESLDNGLPPDNRLSTGNSFVRAVSSTVMAKIAYGETASGIVGQFRWKTPSLGELQFKAEPFVLVLDRIEKPGNIGAILRSANAAGVDAVVLCDGGDLSHPNVIRNSQGSVFTTVCAVATWQQTKDFLDQQGIRPLAARVESSASIYETDLTGSVAIVVGNEAEGLGDRWPAAAGVCGVHIPMVGQVDSLNVGVSASLLVYEAFRRRTLQNR